MAEEIGKATIQLASDYFLNSKALHEGKSMHIEAIEKQTEFFEKDRERALAYHKIELETAILHHNEEIAKSMELHSKDMILSKKALLIQSISELERHFAQLDADLVNATKVK